MYKKAAIIILIVAPILVELASRAGPAAQEIAAAENATTAQPTDQPAGGTTTVAPQGQAQQQTMASQGQTEQQAMTASQGIDPTPTLDTTSMLAQSGESAPSAPPPQMAGPVSMAPGPAPAPVGPPPVNPIGPRPTQYDPGY